MTDLEALLASNRAAVAELVAAAERAEWNRPRAPGRWAAAQVVEHIGRSLEEAVCVRGGSRSRSRPAR